MYIVPSRDFCVHWRRFYLLLSPYLCFISLLYLDKYVLGDDALRSKGYFMQTKHLCVLIHIWTKDEAGAPLNQLKHYSKIFYWPFQGGTSFVDHLCCFCIILLCFHARLFVAALWSPAGKGLTSWLLFPMSNCDVVTFPLVSWVRCGTWLYRFQIFALFLTLYRPDRNIYRYTGSTRAT